MHICLRLITYFSLFPLLAFSQRAYKQGVIVTIKGDTIKGFINYSDGETNPRKISFKTDSTATANVFTPHNIVYFKTTAHGNVAEYTTYSGAVTNNQIDISRLQIGRDTSLVIDTIFLKTIENGKYLTLYAYTDNIKTRFFITEKNNLFPRELIYRIYYSNTETNNGGRTVDENEWKKQLYEIAEKNNVLNNKLSATIENSDYQEENVVNIVSKINGLTKAEVLKNNRSHLQPGYIVLIVVGGLLLLIESIHEFSLAKS